MKSKNKILIASVLIVFFTVFIYPVITGKAVESKRVYNVTIPATAEVGIVNYNRNEVWSYSCPKNNPICSGAGGTGKNILNTYWSSKGGRLTETHITAPRYGSETCTTTVIWSPTTNGYPSEGNPQSVENSCGGKKYTREMCLGADTNEDKLSACTALAVYGNFGKYMTEIGKGSSKTHIVFDSFTRDMNFNVDTKLVLKIINGYPGLYNVTLLVKAFELKDYPPSYTATTRQLGWGEYTIAGKRVGKYSSDAYQVSILIRSGETIEVTPKSNVPLYIFSITAVKAIKIPDNRNIFQQIISRYLS